MATLEELKQEATDLGIKFNPKIGAEKLQEKIDAFYASQETNEAAVKEAVTAKEQEELEGQAFVSKAEKDLVQKKRTRLQKAKEAEQEAKKTVVVEIIDNDPRVNAHTTTCTATCGNEFFDLGTIILPLNTPVEVMKGHINSLKEVRFPHHQLDQKTGLSKVVMRNRYTISYIQDKV